MKRRLVAGAAALLSGLAAGAAVLGGVAIAGRWADVSLSDVAMALYVVFGPGQAYGGLIAAAAAIFAALLTFLSLASLDAVRWLWTAVRAVVLGITIAACLLAGAVAGWALTAPDWQAQIGRTRWWLSDSVAPSLSVSAPATMVRGPAPVTISSSDEGEHYITSVTVDGFAITPTSQFVLDTASLPDGEHTVLVTAEDASRQGNKSSTSAVFRSETQWWTSDVTPPRITLTAPLTTAVSVISIALDTWDEGQHKVTRFTLDGVALPVTRQLTIDTATLADGEHTVLVEAEDDSRQRNQAQARAVFRSDNHPPTITVRFEPAIATQGNVQFVHLQANEPVNVITATLGGKPLTLAHSGAGYWAVSGFAADAITGSVPLLVHAVDVVGHAAHVTATQVVTAFAFPVEHARGDSVDLPAEKTGLLQYGASEAAYLDGVFAPVSAEQLWQGAFVVPVQGRQTSPFAIRRSYNGGPLDSFHGGLDIAADFGTPVPAANRGRVVVAEALKVRGGAVIIDHGMGVYTCYYHLSEIRVKKGQLVEKGQVVGLVGSEGLSTGPHLHWEMRVTGKAVDPRPWTLRSYP